MAAARSARPARAAPSNSAAMKIALQSDPPFAQPSPNPCAALANLQARGDDQIVALEMWAAILGLLSFQPALEKRIVRIWIDNKAAEAILKRGSGKCSDHNRIAHHLWSLAFGARIGIWLERVASKENIADEPSRREFRTLVGLGASFSQPVFCPW